MNKILVLVDVQNVYYTCRDAFAKNFDYNAFWKEVGELGHIEHAYAYAIDRGDDKQRQFQHILRSIGFTVKLKPFIQRSDGSAKGDWDVGITLDAVECAKECDRVILLSGDGDFSLLLQHVRDRYDCQSTVYGVQKLTADSLMRAADSFIAIDSHLLL